MNIWFKRNLLSVMTAVLASTGCSAKVGEIPKYPASTEFVNASAIDSEATLTFVKDLDLDAGFQINLTWVILDDDPVYGIEAARKSFSALDGAYDELYKMPISQFVVQLTRIEPVGKTGSQREVLVFEKQGGENVKIYGDGSHGVRTFESGEFSFIKKNSQASIYHRNLIFVGLLPKGLYRINVKNTNNLPFFKNKHVVLDIQGNRVY